MLKIGLTGGIGSGKSVVSDFFSQLGVPIIDTDVIAHELVTPQSEACNEIIKHFGDTLIEHSGKLNRKRLAKIVFEDETQRKLLEGILHPRINQEINRQIAALETADGKSTSTNYVIIVIPLLLEANLSHMVDRILVVDSDESQRIQRVQKRDLRSKKDIQAIIRNQIDAPNRLSQADDIITNNGTLEQLRSQVQALHQNYLKHR